MSLPYDNYFKEYIKNKDIIIYGDYFNKLENYLINELKNIANVSIVKNVYREYNHTVYEFNSMDEEVDYVAYKIFELINNGLDINNIKLTNISSDYCNIIDKLFRMYNISINIINSSIYGTDICNYFLNGYNSDISIIINKLKEKYKRWFIIRFILDLFGKVYVEI